MHNILIIVGKIMELAVLVACGLIARRFRLLGDEGEKDLSKLLVDFFWPASIFYSIVTGLTPKDITANWLLPVSAVLTAGTGLLIARVFLKVSAFEGDRKKIFLYHSAVNNFVFMVIPFAVLFLGERGKGLLFLHNLGYILFMWTIGVSLLKDGGDSIPLSKRLLTPGLIATVAGITAVLTGISTRIPAFAMTMIGTIEKPILVVAMLIAGSRIYILGLKALKFDWWNIQIGLVRLVLVPAVLLAVTVLLKPYVKPDILIIFMLVNTMPASLFSISLAHKYHSSPELAAEGVVFTHVFGLITMPVFIFLIQKLFEL
ncbi:MAG: AEC family transporter [Spirochaetales bacterium]|nr:AEC family transporter [Spirochaetales bacterium]